MSFALNLDKNAEILIDARIRINVEPPQEITALVAATHGGITITSKGPKMAYTLPADRMIELQISYVDKNQNPATVDGAVTWESSNADIAYVEPTANPPADNSRVMMHAGTQVGNCQISAKADADLGAGTRDLITLMDVTVVGGEAIAGTITPVGDPIPVQAKRK
jgi:hypothetical protein